MESIVDQVKKLLSEPRGRIALHDLVMSELRRVTSQLSEEKFPTDAPFSVEVLRSRVSEYENLTRPLRMIAACLGYWGNSGNHPTLAILHARLMDNLGRRSGKAGWLALRCYPLILVMYSAGIAAVAARRYDNLAAMFFASVGDPEGQYGRVPLIYAVGKALLELNRADVFEMMPGHERQYTPRSEHLVSLLQPELDELLFLGGDYEWLFDRFEMLLALGVGASFQRYQNHFWAPLGRFGWRGRGYRRSPVADLLEEVKSQGEKWEPLRHGVVPVTAGDLDELANELAAIVSQLRWT